MGQRSRLAGDDQAYLRNAQYGNATKLDARVHLHLKYQTAPVGWHSWVVQQAWPEGTEGRGSAVLDVGCGAGWLWANAAGAMPRELRLTLTDLSLGMVDEALARVRAVDQVASVTGSEADAQQLPFLDGAFDVVVANHMLYHVPDPARAVTELARVKATDGVVLVATVGPGHLTTFWEIIRAVFGEDLESQDMATRFDTEVARRTLQAQFSHVEAHHYDDELRCTDPDDVVAYLTSLPPGDEAPPTELERLTAVVNDRFDEADGMLVVPKDVVLFVCR